MKSYYSFLSLAFLICLGPVTTNTRVNNGQSDKIFKGVVSLSTMLFIAEKLAPQLNPETLTSFLQEFKNSAYANGIHKLIMTCWSDKFSKQLQYNPYIESLGYTINDYFINKLLKNLNKSTYLGQFKEVTQRVCAGVLAHVVWALEKRTLATLLI